ncbi:MAG: sporulation protein YtfJ [Clostridia bacterium]|nr:sporulation protein YtfJ [Clostridia bacterium]
MKPKKETGGVTELLTFVTDKAMQLAKENAMLGEPIEKNGLTIIPVSQFSASFAGGGVDSLSNSKQSPAGGGAKVSLVPMSFLVIDGADVRTVNIQTPLQAKVTEIIDNVIESVKNKTN